jgi:hypothetical protein
LDVAGRAEAAEMGVAKGDGDVELAVVIAVMLLA